MTNSQLSLLLRNYHRRLITGIQNVKDSLPADMLEELFAPTETYKYAEVLKDINELKGDWERELLELGSCPSGGDMNNLQLGIFLEAYLDRLSPAIKDLEQNLPDSLISSNSKDLFGKVYHHYGCLEKLWSLEDTLSRTVEMLLIGGENDAERTV